MHIKSPSEIASIKKSSEILSKTLGHITAYVKPNITTQELDKLAPALTI
ncbi:MAG: hypothetical protein AAF380_00495 [Bacteroidota bacterium]